MKKRDGIKVTCGQWAIKRARKAHPPHTRGGGGGGGRARNDGWLTFWIGRARGDREILSSPFTDFEFPPPPGAPHSFSARTPDEDFTACSLPRFFLEAIVRVVANCPYRRSADPSFPL